MVDAHVLRVLLASIAELYMLVLTLQEDDSLDEQLRDCA